MDTNGLIWMILKGRFMETRRCLSCMMLTATIMVAGQANAFARPAGSHIDLTLTGFEHLNQEWTWVRIDPISKRRSVLATFSIGMADPSVNWRSDGKQALIRFSPVNDGGEGARGKTELFLWDRDAKLTTRIPLPPKVADFVHGVKPSDSTDLEVLAFDRANRVLALTLERRKIPATVLENGKTYHLTGLDDVLAHAYSWKEGSWHEVETKKSTYGGEISVGIEALQASRDIDRTDLTGNVRENFRPVQDKSDLAELKQAVARNQSDPDPERLYDLFWDKMDTTYGPVYCAELSNDLGSEISIPVLFRRGGSLRLAAKLDFAHRKNERRGPYWKTWITPSVRGHYLLIESTTFNGLPRLYNLTDGKLIFSSDTTRAVSFWPRDCH